MIEENVLNGLFEELEEIARSVDKVIGETNDDLIRKARGVELHKRLDHCEKTISELEKNGATPEELEEVQQEFAYTARKLLTGIFDLQHI